MLYIGIPAYNEATTIGVLLWRLRTVLGDVSREYEVVVYDDASTDETADILAPYARVLPLTVLRGSRRLGTGGAIDAIVRHVSRTTRYPRRDGLLLMQGDFTDPPALVPEFLRRFEGGADLIIGERASVGDAPVPVRRLFTASRWVLRPFVGITDVRDLTSSFRLARIAVLRDLLKASGDAPVAAGEGWAAQADFLLRAAPHARRVETIPVTPTFGVRVRDTRRLGWPDAIALAKWGWGHRGQRIAVKVIARTVEAPAEVAETPEVAETERPERPERRPEAAAASTAEAGERRGRRERGARPERGERAGRGERAERGERPERAERPDRPERGERRAKKPRGEAAPAAGVSLGAADETERAEPMAAADGTPSAELSAGGAEVPEGSERGARKRRRSRRGSRSADGTRAPGEEGAEDTLAAESSTEEFAPTGALSEGEDASGEESLDADGRPRKRRRARRSRRKRGEAGEPLESSQGDAAAEQEEGQERAPRDPDAPRRRARSDEASGADEDAGGAEAGSEDAGSDDAGADEASRRRRSRRGRRGGRRRGGSGGGAGSGGESDGATDAAPDREPPPSTND